MILVGHLEMFPGTLMGAVLGGGPGVPVSFTMCVGRMGEMLFVDVGFPYLDPDKTAFQNPRNDNQLAR